MRQPKTIYENLNAFYHLNFVFFLLTGSSCKKDDELTKPTQEGKNTFSCKVNGEVFLPNDGGLLSPVRAIDASVINSPDGKTKRLVILTNKSKSSSIQKIYLFIDNINGIGTYQLNGAKRHCEYINTNPTSNPPLDKKFTTEINNEGTVVITSYDLITGIVSGTFSFDAVNSSGEKVEIRNGRFDVVFTK